MIMINGIPNLSTKDNLAKNLRPVRVFWLKNVGGLFHKATVIFNSIESKSIMITVTVDPRPL